MKNCPYSPWVYATCLLIMFSVTASGPAQRGNNDISLDFDKLENLGQTDSLIEALKDIAQSSHDCGIKEIPKLRRFFLSNSSITCNDGSPAGYYLRKSYGSTKWTLFLEGGWYCFDRVSCSMRWANSMKKFMSSKGWPETKRVSGILSWNPEENPYYFHSNMVYIPYCSSDSWSGTAAAGSNDSEFAFMGSLILEQVIRDLIPKGLKHASKLILTGSSAGGTGVLINLDRVANLMTDLAPKVEVRGIADSGWFLDSPRYSYKDCVEAHSCAPTDVVKRGIKLWQGRVPDACQNQYPESEHWRCYFGYRMYPTLKTPLYVIQFLFDEAQILVDNVFEQRQISGENSASLVSKSQWEYLHKLGQEVRNTLQNVSAVFAPACLSHELLMRKDWHNVTVNNVKLGQSIYCWENSYGPDKCPLTNKKTDNVIKNIDSPQRDAPKSRESKTQRNRRRRKKSKKRRKRKKCKDNSSKKCIKDKKKRKKRRDKNGRRRRRSRRHHTGNCSHHLIDSCPLPQCNCSCPKYRNRRTGAEMDFFKLFVRYGLDKEEIAEILGRDIASVEAMDDNTISRLIWDLVSTKN